MRSLPPLNALRAFEAAGRHQSFSGAATELSVSHSAISRHVRGLEDRLGAQLFKDLPRGVALTPEGERYLSQITPALDVIAEASQVFADKPRGRLVINSEPLFAQTVLIPRLDEFYAAHPEVELRLEASDSHANLSRYEADLAIRFISLGEPDAETDLISNAPMAVFGTPDLVGSGLSEPRDVLEFERLQDRGGHPWGVWAAKAGLPADLFPPPSWRMRAHLSFFSALSGQGLFLCSSELLEISVTEGRMVQCLDTVVSQGHFRLLASEGARKTRAARVFRDWLLQVTTHLRN